MMSYGQFSRSHKYSTCQFGGSFHILPFGHTMTHRCLLRLEVADQSPAAHRPGLGLLHCTNLWVATDVSVERKEPIRRGWGQYLWWIFFFGGGMNIRLPGKTLRVQQKISGYVFTNAYDFWKAWLHAFWEKYRQSPFLFNSGPRRPSCWIASGFIRIQLSRDCCNPSSSALQSWI